MSCVKLNNEVRLDNGIVVGLRLVKSRKLSKVVASLKVAAHLIPNVLVVDLEMGGILLGG